MAWRSRVGGGGSKLPVSFCLPTFLEDRIGLVSKTSEAVVQGCSVNKVFLEISQNPQENTCARVSFLINTFFNKHQHLWWLLLKTSLDINIAVSHPCQK